MNTLLIKNNFKENSDNFITERYTKTINNRGLSLLSIQKESPLDKYFIAILFDEEYDEVADFFVQDKDLNTCTEKAIKLFPDFMSKKTHKELQC
jgi:hypothetical protein